MPKAMSVGKKIAIGSAAALGLGGVGAGGFLFGKRTGAEQMGSEMASQFSRLNSIENIQIAKHFLDLGRRSKGVSMEKASALKNIYDEAFNDEFEKIAKKMPAFNRMIKSIKGWAGPQATKTLKSMKKHPLATAGIAAGAGLGVGGVGGALLTRD